MHLEVGWRREVFESNQISGKCQISLKMVQATEIYNKYTKENKTVKSHCPLHGFKQHQLTRCITIHWSGHYDRLPDIVLVHLLLRKHLWFIESTKPPKVCCGICHQGVTILGILFPWKDVRGIHHTKSIVHSSAVLFWWSLAHCWHFWCQKTEKAKLL